MIKDNKECLELAWCVQAMLYLNLYLLVQQSVIVQYHQ